MTSFELVSAAVDFFSIELMSLYVVSINQSQGSSLRRFQFDDQQSIKAFASLETASGYLMVVLISIVQTYLAILHLVVVEGGILVAAVCIRSAWSRGAHGAGSRRHLG